MIDYLQAVMYNKRRKGGNTMKLPKARITLDLDHDLLEWVMRKVQETKNSRNEVIGRIIRLAKESEENEAQMDER
jgi:metal-responsive CopG/Arc/MetJ family transcriptional regulator